MARFKSHRRGGNSAHNAALILALTAATGLAIVPATHGAAYSITGLGFLAGGSASYGYGINASGQVVGPAAISGNRYDRHAFLYSAGAMADLGTLGGTYSYASGINASGQVVGGAQTSSGAY